MKNTLKAFALSLTFCLAIPMAQAQHPSTLECECDLFNPVCGLCCLNLCACGTAVGTLYPGISLIITGAATGAVGKIVGGAFLTNCGIVPAIASCLPCCMSTAGLLNSCCSTPAENPTIPQIDPPATPPVAAANGDGNINSISHYQYIPDDDSDEESKGEKRISVSSILPPRIYGEPSTTSIGAYPNLMTQPQTPLSTTTSTTQTNEGHVAALLNTDGTIEGETENTAYVSCYPNLMNPPQTPSETTDSRGEGEAPRFGTFAILPNTPVILPPPVYGVWTEVGVTSGQQTPPPPLYSPSSKR